MNANDYQKRAHEFADYPVPKLVSKLTDSKGKEIIMTETLEYIYPAFEIAEEVGEVVGKYAKAIRDCNGVIDFQRRQEIKKELGDVCWGIAELARLLGFTLEEVLEGNIEKLESRKARNVIHGSGDNR